MSGILTLGFINEIKRDTTENTPKKPTFISLTPATIPDIIIAKNKIIRSQKTWNHVNKPNKIALLMNYIDKLFKSPHEFTNNADLVNSYSQPALIYKISDMVKKNKFNSNDSVIFNGTTIEEIKIKIE